MSAREDLAAQLREVERGEAAGWIAWSRGPAWLPAALGAWAAAFVLALGYLDDRPRALAMLALTALSISYLSWQTRRHGVWPSGGVGGFRRSTSVFVGGLALVGVLGVLTTLVAPAWVVALVAAAATTTVTWAYGAVYAADADRVRRRLDGPA